VLALLRSTLFVRTRFLRDFVVRTAHTKRETRGVLAFESISTVRGALCVNTARGRGSAMRQVRF